MNTSPEELVTIILAILGILLQLAFRYGGKFSDWYQAHNNKGVLALAFSALIGVVYYGLSCTPYASQFNIALVCDQSGLFTTLHAIYLIALTQTAAFVILPKTK
jgi:hypothetical protein